MNIWDKAKQKISGLFNVKNPDVEFLVQNVQKGVMATNRNGARVVYLVPERGADLNSLVRALARNNIPAIQYQSTLFPKPIISIKFEDYYGTVEHCGKNDKFVEALSMALSAKQKSTQEATSVRNRQRTR